LRKLQVQSVWGRSEQTVAKPKLNFVSRDLPPKKNDN